MFKVGDKVRIVSSILHFSEGDRAVVSEFKDPYLKVAGCDRRFNKGWWLLDEEVTAQKHLGSTDAVTRYLPDNDVERKDYPLFDGLFAYFPNTLCEVSRWSKAGNEQHNPGEELHWAKDKSTDHKNKILRHLLDAEQVNSQGFYEAVGMAWRALALCEEILVASGKPWGPNVK